MAKRKRIPYQQTGYPRIYKREGPKGVRYQVTARLRDPESGVMKPKWLKTFRTLAEARRYDTEVQARKDKGEHSTPSKLPLRDWIANGWLPIVRNDLKPSTYESYASNLRNHVFPTIGSTPLEQITPGLLSSLYRDLQHEKGLKARTARYVHTILRRALEDAVERGDLIRNPAAAKRIAPGAKATKPPPFITWSAAELRRFLEHVREDRLYAAWVFAATTGVRRGELLGLRWSSLDLEADPPTARIHETLIGSRKWSTTKTDVERTIDLWPETVAALRAHRKRQAEERLAAGPAYDDHDLVFAREDGTPAWPQSVSRAFDRLVKSSGLPRIPLKSLRHTHATLLAESGVQPGVVAERLGHASEVTTLRYYTRTTPQMRSEAAAKLSARIFG